MSESIESTEPRGVAAYDGRKVFIFAGGFNEAERWRTLYTELAPTQVRYVRDMRDLRGYRSQRGVIWGSFWDRRDAHDLVEYARFCEIEWIDTDD